LAKLARGGNLREQHSGDNTHSRAGWAATLAGEAGLMLEKLFGTETAGALIYAVSPPNKPIPPFIWGQ
jgi:hypothetical protein